MSVISARLDCVVIEIIGIIYFRLAAACFWCLSRRNRASWWFVFSVFLLWLPVTVTRTRHGSIYTPPTIGRHSLYKCRSLLAGLADYFNGRYLFSNFSWVDIFFQFLRSPVSWLVLVPCRHLVGFPVTRLHVLREGLRSLDSSWVGFEFWIGTGHGKACSSQFLPVF